jgi:hypothetical protein
MKPRSAACAVRMSVPRFITAAIFSSPLENLIPSTLVGMLGNVESTAFDSTPLLNGVYRFGSNVSVCAMPPAIHRTMTQSARGAIFSMLSEAKTRDSFAARAPSVAAEADFRKSRRFIVFIICVSVGVVSRRNAMIDRHHLRLQKDGMFSRSVG